MRQISGDVEKISGAHDEMLFEFLAIPHSGFAAEYIERSFVVRVLVRLCPYARRDRRDLQMNSLRSGGLRGNTRRQQMSLLAGKFRARAHDGRFPVEARE